MNPRTRLALVTCCFLVLFVVTALPATVLAGGEDCLPYDPNALYIVPDGDHWLLTDGVSRMVILDNEADANRALAVAQRHTAHCFVGRDNTRPNRGDYIVEYWTGDSGLSPAAFDEDCLPFNPADVYYAAEGSDWLVTDGVSRMLMVSSEVDAQSVLNIINDYGFNEHCFIGRDNTRPNRSDYIMEYWNAPSVLRIDPGLVLEIDPGVLQIDPGVLVPPATTTEDCLPYDPNNLYVVPDGDHWLLTDGSMRINILDNEADAQAALAVAQNHTAQCFIGRNNTRPERKNFIFDYWGGDSGWNVAQANADCLSYDPASLYVTPQGDYWLLTDGRMAMNTLDTEGDANAALAVAQGYNAQCFIGRGNTRENRIDYIFQYWATIEEGGGVIEPGVIEPIDPGVLVPPPVIASEDCLPYNPASLYVVQEGDYWLLTDDVSRMVILDNEADANLALQVAQGHTQHCFIGRNNTRPNRSDFIMEYWR